MSPVSDTLLQQKVVTAQHFNALPVADMAATNLFLEGLEHQPIDQVCWFPLQNIPVVRFAAAYTNDALLIKYYVRETAHRAVYTQPNDPVFKDSCVELFIAVDQSGNYYNFEFNTLGACLASYGKDRNNRIKLTSEVIGTIKRWVEWKQYSPQNNRFEWELTLILPVTAFCFDSVVCNSSQSFRVNLYKCGDDLAEPHYLAWNPVLSERPDFHQSQFFGLLKLA
jgi:hypothetical protein